MPPSQIAELVKRAEEAARLGFNQAAVLADLAGYIERQRTAIDNGLGGRRQREAAINRALEASQSLTKKNKGCFPGVER